jgi:ABC-type thiamin/hydroxymethylpyrimidine transport system permease subunit
VTPTRPLQLIVLGVLASAIGWAAVQLSQGIFAGTLPVPWTAAMTLALLALSLFCWSLIIRPRILHKKGAKPLSPFVAARSAALAMAASRTGAIVAGFYGGAVIGLSPNYAMAITRQRLWLALAAAVAAVLVVLAALWLEHICRLDDDDKDGPKQGNGVTNRNESQSSDWVLPSARSRRRRKSEL